MSCPNSTNVNIIVPPGTCLPVEGCPGGPPVEVTGPDGTPVEVEVANFPASQAVTIADCADVVQGCLNDAANTTGAAGTNSGKLRGILSILANVWDSATGVIKADWFISGNEVQRQFYVPSFDDNVAFTFAEAQAGTDFIRFISYPIISNGQKFVRERTPSVFNTAQANAAGNTALWTPAAGNSFRLMRYMVIVTGNASFAVAGILNISLFDGAAGPTGQVHDVYIPIAAGIVPGDVYNSGWIDLGNGFLSGAANNVLNVNLSAALVTGNVRVICCGTEE